MRKTMIHQSARPVENHRRSPSCQNGRCRAILPPYGLLLLVCCNVIASLPARGEPSPAEPTVVLHGNPGKTTSDLPTPQSPIAPVPVASTPNALILEAVAAMPSGGNYRANTAAVAALRNSVQARNAQLLIDPSRATPSFCSGATYLIFLSVLDRLHREGHIQLDDATLGALLVQDHQADGAGVWGRWNANGPGTARLFAETGLGRNFTSFDEAQPGDFLKVFWNDEIGAREAGHSVVYLGTVSRPEGEFVRYWSSNMPNGFGMAEVPRQRIHRALFSRLEHPEQIHRIASIPARDAYLAAMLKRPSTGEEMAQMVGLKDNSFTRLATAPIGSSSGNTHPPLSDKSPSNPRTVSASSPTPAPANDAPRKGFLRLWPFGGHRNPTPSPTPAPQ